MCFWEPDHNAALAERASSGFSLDLLTSWRPLLMSLAFQAIWLLKFPHLTGWNWPLVRYWISFFMLHGKVPSANFSVVIFLGKSKQMGQECHRQLPKSAVAAMLPCSFPFLMLFLNRKKPKIIPIIGHLKLCLPWWYCKGQNRHSG